MEDGLYRAHWDCAAFGDNDLFDIGQADRSDNCFADRCQRAACTTAKSGLRYRGRSACFNAGRCGNSEYEYGSARPITGWRRPRPLGQRRQAAPRWTTGGPGRIICDSTEWRQPVYAAGLYLTAERNLSLSCAGKCKRGGKTYADAQADTAKCQCPAYTCSWCNAEDITDASGH